MIADKRWKDKVKFDMINRTLYCETYNLVKLKIPIYTYIVSTI